jgi:hypothetical protein
MKSFCRSSQSESASELSEASSRCLLMAQDWVPIVEKLNGRVLSFSTTVSVSSGIELRIELREGPCPPQIVLTDSSRALYLT